METVLVIQLMVGFHLHSQGIPKITCGHPRLRTIRSVVSLLCEKRISVRAFSYGPLGISRSIYVVCSNQFG